MAFLKRNIFNIILVIVTAAICGGLYIFVISPKAELNKDEVSTREDYNGRIASLKSAGVNEEMVRYEAQRIDKLQESYNTLQTKLEQMNRSGRDSLVISIPEKDVEFPAFPVDRKLYSQHQVQLRFPTVYRAAMNELFASLNATIPPEEFEIDIAVNKMFNYMLQQHKDKADSSGTIADLPSGLADGFGSGSFGDKAGRPNMGGMDMNMGIAPGYDPNYGGMANNGGYPVTGMPGRRTTPTARAGRNRIDRGGVQTEDAVSQSQALEAAINNLYVQKVTSSHRSVYAFKDQAFQYHYLPDNVDADIAEMWKSNVNYWIHKYVVDSIKSANQKRSQEMGVASTISNATVKRLVSVSIGQGGDSRIGGAARAVKMYTGETAGQSQEDNQNTGGGFGDYGGYGGGFGGYGQQADTSSDSSGGAGLTSRTCTPQYDVVNFEFTVVLAAQKLLEFEEMLVANDFYTIQEVDMSDPYLETESRQGFTGSSAPAENTYYYGHEPVVKVTFQMEALMFSQWARKMMPEEMLQRLPADALRPEDSEKIDAFLAGPLPEEDQQTY